jgi:hypothetical protein
MKLTAKKRAILSSILSLGITLGIIGILMGTYLLLCVFNDKLLEEDLNSSNYYRSVAKEAMQQVEEVMKASSLSMEVIEDTVSEEKVYTYCTSYIKAKLSGEKSSFDSEMFQKSLVSNIQTYLEQNQVSVQDSEQQSVERLADTVTKICEDHISFTYINYYLKFRNTYQKWGYRLIFAGCILILCMVCSLLALYHHRYRALRYVISGMIGSVLLAFVHYFYLKTSSWMLDDLDFLTDYYMDFIYQFYQDCRLCMLPIIGCEIVVTALLAILMRYLRKKSI